MSTIAPAVHDAGAPARIALEIVDFLTMREDQSPYVDKTGAILDFLIPGRYPRRAFILRPRRFGKSLALSVMAEMLAVGELPNGVQAWPGFRQADPATVFHGLQAHTRLLAGDTAAAAVLNQAHFVIQLSLSCADTGSDFERSVVSQLASIGRDAFGPIVGHSIKCAPDVDEAFQLLTDAIPDRVPIAVLVDEYDHAIVNDVSQLRWDAANQGIAVLRKLMMTSKDLRLNRRIKRFVVTGVARVAQASLFSGANNFVDMTAYPVASRMFGFNAEELQASFPGELARVGQAVGAALGMTVKDATEQKALAMTALKEWYNGYCFDGVTTCYAPGPVLASLAAGDLTGLEMGGGQSRRWLGLVPSSVLSYLGADCTQHIRAEVQRFEIADLEAQRINVAAMFLQVGLLTIKPTPSASAPGASGAAVALQPPNLYARKMLLGMVAQMTGRSMKKEVVEAERVQVAVAADDHAAFESAIRELLTGIPHSSTKMKPGADAGQPGAPPLLGEAPHHACLYGFLRAALSGTLCDMAVEEQAACGAADVVIKRRDHATGEVGGVWVLGISVATESKEKHVEKLLMQQLEQGLGCYEPYKRLPGRVCAVLIDRDDKAVHFSWRRWDETTQTWLQ